MSSDNLILEHLKAIRGDINSIKEDIRELKARVTGLEHGQATIIQQIGYMAGEHAEQHV